MFTLTATSAANPLDVPYFESSYDTLAEAIAGVRCALVVANSPDSRPRANNRAGEVLGIDLVDTAGEPLEHLAVVRAE